MFGKLALVKGIVELGKPFEWKQQNIIVGI